MNTPRRRQPFVASNNSLRLVRKKLWKVRTFDHEPLRRRLERLEQEFEKLARLNAKAQERAQGEPAPTGAENNASGDDAKSDGKRAGNAPVPNVSFDEWELKLQELIEDCDASIEKVEKRRRAFPKISYESELPVVARREEIRKLIRDNQVVIVCGETGSGKSTQLPKICMELGLGARGIIGHTQPRRIAARSIAQRVADELHTPLGQGVGYKIRFTDETSENTFVKLMTDGILLAETQTDRYFNRYEVIIIDEAHERSLNIDFLLGMLKRVLRRRRDLKVVVTSATIDAKRFAEHFAGPNGPAPIVEVSGRTYPIEILYRPVDELKERRAQAQGVAVKGGGDADDEDAFEATLVDAVQEVARLGRGDMLIFMPTERDIFETAKLLKGIHIPGDDAARKTLILPLYARLPSEEQQKIFGKIPHRKIVVATNVAESSLTVPGIRYVIDTGTARISRYSARSMTQRLPIEPISQASADQRAGRCGRVGPGVCVRLYSEQDYNGRSKYTTPEILRTNLASIILQTKALRLGDVERFPFVDPPRHAAIEDGYKTLFELGAIDEKRELTEVGKTLSRLPVDPRIGRIILAADEENALREVLPIAAALEIQDPRERPREKQESADLKHAPFQDENSDFLSFLKLWDFWQNLKEKTTRSQLRKACRENFLNFNRMREWSDIYVQLLQMLRGLDLRLRARRDDYNAIHRAILAGLLYGVAQKSESGSEYSATNAGKFLIWPGSGLKKKPQWVVGAERLETSRSYLHTVAKIDPAWIEELGARLIKRAYKDPFWSRETGYVHAYERATLYGLTIVPRRRINYGPLDPEKSRQIFIYEALVNREFDCTLPFFEHNGKVEEEAKRLGDKLRQYDFVKAYDAIYDFYDARIPKDVYDATTLKQWHKSASSAERRALFATLTDFCAADDLDEKTIESFPDEIAFDGGGSFPLEYRFNPGGEDDGVSIVAPIEGLRQLDARKIGWLVPGLLEQRVVALLKTLPKEIRRDLVPVPDTAREIVRKLRFGEGELEEILAREASRRSGHAVSHDDFDYDRVPLELQFNVRVVDETGKLVAEGRRPDELRKRLGVEMNKSISAVVDPKWNRDGVVKWDFGALPDSVAIKRGGLVVSAYPALCDPRFLSKDFAPRDASDRTVALRLFDSRDKALRHTQLGIQRLFTLDNLRDLRTQAKWFPNVERLRVYASSLPDFDFDAAIAELVAARALDLDMLDLPTNEGEFNNAANRARKRIGLAVQELVGWAARFLEAYQEACLAIERFRRGPADSVARDCAVQVARLTPPRFYLTTPWQWLREYPRYFKAIPMRFDKFLNGGSRSDPQFAGELAQYWSRYEQAEKDAESAGVFDPELENFRWAIEEYRVSLFAQKLGTSIKVSPVRLEKIWEKVMR
ncbi:MAG: ATP-dependent RNA helicase HrpA [Thermoguttaceae bacterium]|nr:ATP-dependent RNA helicase HrpA [Thermoguttaceae bacterium]